MKTAILVILGLQASVSFAELDKHRPQQIDFNTMIEANNGRVNRMQQDLSKKGFGAPPKAEKASAKKVIDFLDMEVVEVGRGEAPRIGDRRYN